METGPLVTTRLTFFSTAAAVPGAGEDTASFLINGTLVRLWLIRRVEDAAIRL